MGMVTDDQVDALLARGKPSPVFQLLLIRHDAPFEPVMDGEDAVVGPKLHEAVHHELEIFRIAVRRLSGLVLAGAMLLTLAGDNAGRAKGDPAAAIFQAAGPRRLLDIGADAGIGNGPLRRRHGHVIERLFRAVRAIIHRVIVGEREQVEAGIDERLHAERMALEVVRRFLALAIGDEIVAVGDHRLEIDEGEVAVDLGRDAAKGVFEAQERAILADTIGLDCGAVRIEPGIAGKHDGETVGAGGFRGRAADRGGELGAGARPKPDGAFTRTCALKSARAHGERDDGRCGAETPK